MFYSWDPGDKVGLCVGARAREQCTFVPGSVISSDMACRNLSRGNAAHVRENLGTLCFADTSNLCSW